MAPQPPDGFPEAGRIGAPVATFRRGPGKLPKRCNNRHEPGKLPKRRDDPARFRQAAHPAISIPERRTRP